MSFPAEPFDENQRSRTTPERSEASLIYSFDDISEELLPKVGGKAANLIFLRKSGLPVPAGFCIPIATHEYYLENNELPAGLIEEIVKAKNSLGGKVAIRSSATSEDGTDVSMAGVFQTHYVYKDAEIPQVITHIYTQSRSKEVAQFMSLLDKSVEDVHMALIVQELIEPELSGVIYSGINGDSLLIQYVDGFGASLANGQTRGNSILLGPDTTIVQSSGFETNPLPPAIIAQVARYTRVVEKLFPGFPQDIEFACREGRVYVLQARALTTKIGNIELTVTPQETVEATKKKLKQLVREEKQELGTDAVIFSDGNYSELLPRPTEMDIGIYMYVWGGSDGIPGATQLGRGDMGYEAGDETIGIIQYIGGRTYFTIGRYAGLYHIGIPETKNEYYSTLVNEYLEAIQNDPQKASYPQMGLFLQDPSFEDLRNRFGDRAAKYYQTYRTFSANMRNLADHFISQFEREGLPQTTTFIQDMQKVALSSLNDHRLLLHAIGIMEHIRTRSYVDFVKGARLGFYYSQRLQDLLQQKVGLGKDEAKMLYSRLNQGLEGSAITEANIAIAQAASEEEAMEKARQVVGHFNTGEMLEIRHRPLRDDPVSLLAYVQGIRQPGNYVEQFEAQKAGRLEAQRHLLSNVAFADKEEFEHIIRSSQTYMALREKTKYLVAQEYLLLRDALEALGKRKGMESGDVYYVYPRELPLLVSDARSMLHIIRARKQAFKNYEKLKMPHVIRESDIDTLGILNETDEEFTQAMGNFLAEGPLIDRGTIINVDEFQTLSEVNDAMKKHKDLGIPVILVGSQMNLNHDYLIAQASGVVIENAGIVAHGAQRARDLGKGAIGGIKSNQLKTGMNVLFDPTNKIVRKLE